MRSGKQVISTSESFDRVKLSRLKYLQLQTNKYFSELNLKWLCAVYRDGVYKDVVRSDEQNSLQNLLFRLAGQVNSELVGSMRKMERMTRELFGIFTV